VFAVLILATLLLLLFDFVLLDFTLLLFVFVLLAVVGLTRLLLGMGGFITLVCFCALFTTFPLVVFKVFSRITFLAFTLLFLGVSARERERVTDPSLPAVPGIAVATRPAAIFGRFAGVVRFAGVARFVGVFGRFVDGARFAGVFGRFVDGARFAGVFGRFAVLGAVFGLVRVVEVPGRGVEVAVLFTFIPDDALELFDLVKTDLELGGFLFLTALMTFLYFPDILYCT